MLANTFKVFYPKLGMAEAFGVDNSYNMLA